MADDLGREATVLVAIGRWCVHATSMAHHAGAVQAAQEVDNAMIYVREGAGPERATYGPKPSVDQVLAQIGDRRLRYFAQLPTAPTNRPDLTKFRDPQYVVVEVTAEEAKEALAEPGFYLSEGLSPTEAEQWL
jgi:hypothetical protein